MTPSTSLRTGLQLYGHPFSSYTWKALIPLYANGSAFEFRELGPDFPRHSEFVQQHHPAGKFPVLEDGDHVVVEATAIVEYLAVHHPGPAPLIPDDAAQAATARMLDRVFDNYVMANLQRVVAAYIADKDHPDPKEVEAGKEGLRRAYAWLEKWLSANLLPPHVSLVTCAAAPSLFYADWVERIPEDCPRLAALRAELLALPPVARCVDDARPYRAYFPPGAPDRD
ncbi:MAG: glutathione S-transferase family protein [Sphingomonas sp.]|nr:glutathione S-transferase family protein [Sphingomonas sp.]